MSIYLMRSDMNVRIFRESVPKIKQGEYNWVQRVYSARDKERYSLLFYCPTCQRFFSDSHNLFIIYSSLNIIFNCEELLARKLSHWGVSQLPSVLESSD